MAQRPEPLDRHVARVRAERAELRYGFVLLVGCLLALVASAAMRALDRATRLADLVVLTSGLLVAYALQRTIERRRPAWFRRGAEPPSRPSA